MKKVQGDEPLTLFTSFDEVICGYPGQYYKRPDGSIIMSFGDPRKGPHEQFDFEGTECLAHKLIQAYNEKFKDDHI